jgi:hypothetical protein
VSRTDKSYNLLPEKRFISHPEKAHIQEGIINMRWKQYSHPEKTKE